MVADFNSNTCLRSEFAGAYGDNKGNIGSYIVQSKENGWDLILRYTADDGKGRKIIV